MIKERIIKSVSLGALQEINMGGEICSVIS